MKKIVLFALLVMPITSQAAKLDYFDNESFLLGASTSLAMTFSYAGQTVHSMASEYGVPETWGENIDEECENANEDEGGSIGASLIAECNFSKAYDLLKNENKTQRVTSWAKLTLSQKAQFELDPTSDAWEKKVIAECKNVKNSDPDFEMDAETKAYVLKYNQGFCLMNKQHEAALKLRKLAGAVSDSETNYNSCSLAPIEDLCSAFGVEDKALMGIYNEYKNTPYKMVSESVVNKTKKTEVDTTIGKLLYPQLLIYNKGKRSVCNTNEKVIGACLAVTRAVSVVDKAKAIEVLKKDFSAEKNTFACLAEYTNERIGKIFQTTLLTALPKEKKVKEYLDNRSARSSELFDLKTRCSDSNFAYECKNSSFDLIFKGGKVLPVKKLSSNDGEVVSTGAAPLQVILPVQTMDSESMIFSYAKDQSTIVPMNCTSTEGQTDSDYGMVDRDTGKDVDAATGTSQSSKAQGQ